MHVYDIMWVQQFDLKCIQPQYEKKIYVAIACILNASTSVSGVVSCLHEVSQVKTTETPHRVRVEILAYYLIIQ